MSSLEPNLRERLSTIQTAIRTINNNVKNVTEKLKKKGKESETNKPKLDKSHRRHRSLSFGKLFQSKHKDEGELALDKFEEDLHQLQQSLAKLDNELLKTVDYVPAAAAQTITHATTQTQQTPPVTYASKPPPAAVHAAPSASAKDLSCYEREKLLCELEILYDKTPIGLCLVDEHLRFVRVNTMMSTMTGIPASKHAGLQIRDVFSELASSMEDIYKDVFNTGLPRLDVELCYEKDQKKRFFHASFYPVTFPHELDGASTTDSLATPSLSDYSRTPASSPTIGLTTPPPALRKVHAVATVAKDITDIKQKEDDLVREKLRVEEANRAKSKFLAHMSHELRTPMACILGMVNILQESELTNDQQECVNAIQQNGGSLLQILNDVLDLTKVEAGRVVLEKSRFDVLSMAEKVAEIFSFKVYERKLQLVIKFDPELPVSFIGDEVRIRQILWNLVGNACKFTDYGHISIEVAKLPRRGNHNYDKTHGLFFKISDTGIGIPEDQISGIFNEFNQANNQASRSYSGTGLGLAIVDQFVQKMEGHIVLKSKVKQGTSFSVYLPLEIAPDSPTLSDLPVINRVKRVSQQKAFQWVIVSDCDVIYNCIVGYLQLCGLEPYKRFHDSDEFATVVVSNREEYNREDVIVIYDSNTVEQACKLKCQSNSLHPMAPSIIVIPLAEKAKMKMKETPFSRFLVKPIPLTGLLECFCDTMDLVHNPEPNLEKREQPESQLVHIFPHLKVLVVEDNPTNVKILVRILKKFQCEVVDNAEHGQKALDMLSKAHYDIVFMDLQMPILDGYAATERIREAEKASGNHLIIIAVTAHAMSADKVKCLEVGMDDFISKPIEALQVQTILCKYSDLSKGIVNTGN